MMSGFSYHLARASEPMFIEIPVRFSGAHGNTVQIAVDLAAILKGGSNVGESASTHSREGDELAIAMKGRVAGAFQLVDVRPDIFQTDGEVLKQRVTTTQNRPSAGTPHRFQVSERLPKIKLPADNPLTQEGVALGRDLFHDTR